MLGCFIKRLKNTDMKKTVIIIYSAFCLLVIGQATAQIGAKKDHDARVERMLDAVELKYQIDSDGDFKLANRFENGRTQIVFVESNTEKYQKMEIREIWSVAYISDGFLSPSIMRTLLKDNGNKKLGGWKLATSDGKECAVFYVQIAADAEKIAFVSALQLASQAADEMEKQLTGKDEL
jgi:hypothetical protein